MEPLGKIAKFDRRAAGKPKADSHLHSPAHLLADELSVKLNDRRHFALYLGLGKKFDHNFLRKVLGEVLESPSVKSPGKLFAFLVKKHSQENSGTAQPD
ncbi:MAG TPA: hypothetical protein VHA30_04785 [Patescibacteria group bacterium]|nr:hypothetical protein [Patescibacteria group bacterium]